MRSSRLKLEQWNLKHIIMLSFLKQQSSHLFLRSALLCSRHIYFFPSNTNFSSIFSSTPWYGVISLISVFSICGLLCLFFVNKPTSFYHLGAREVFCTACLEQYFSATVAYYLTYYVVSRSAVVACFAYHGIHFFHFHMAE